MIALIDYRTTEEEKKSLIKLGLEFIEVPRCPKVYDAIDGHVDIQLNILDKKEENLPLYCFYLYVRTLQKRELDNTLMTTEIIKKYYENGEDAYLMLKEF